MSWTDLKIASDEELVAGAQREDEDCIAALCDQYYDRIYRFALARMGNPSDAEDLTQETFLHMVTKINTFKWQGVNFTAWLFRIAHNAIIDLVRHRSSRGQEVSMENLYLVTKDDPEAEALRTLSAESLMVAVQKLTQAQQEVITMRFAAELSVSETARALGKAEGTVKATQFQAFQALRNVLQAEHLV